MTADLEKATERDVLEAHLDRARETIIALCSGVSWSDATKRLGPSATSIAGVLKHLINVELVWYSLHMGGQQDIEFDWSDDEADLEFTFREGENMDSLLERYRAVCDQSREIVKGLSLEDLAQIPYDDGRHPPLRLIHQHMVFETVRHAGHLDIYRELIDGTVGIEA